MAVEITSVTRVGGPNCGHLRIQATFDGASLDFEIGEQEALDKITANIAEARRLFTVLVVARCHLRGEPLTGVKVPNPGGVASAGGGGGTSAPGGVGERP